jgi:hypothetical protein
MTTIREDTGPNGIGFWEKTCQEPGNPIDARIARWCRCLDLDAVVWTKLGPQWMDKAKKVPRMPTLDEILAKLKEWGEPMGTYARLYLQMAPKQIDTPYRREIFRRNNWQVLSPYLHGASGLRSERSGLIAWVERTGAGKVRWALNRGAARTAATFWACCSNLIRPGQATRSG